MTTPELMTRLGKLIPLLASDKPGEVTATAAAITRALKGAGLDWHDVSKWIEAGPGKPHHSSSRSDAWNRSNTEAEQARQRQARQQREREQYNQYGNQSRSSSYAKPEEPPDWKPALNSVQTQGLARRILAMDTTYLSANEMEFLRNMTEWNSWATFKQENWIRKIAAKMRITV